MEDSKLIALILGNSALWELIRYVHQYQMNKKLTKAELRAKQVETDVMASTNWQKWSDKMEERVNELEKDNKELRMIIIKQRERINDLEIKNNMLAHTLKKYQPKDENR